MNNNIKKTVPKSVDEIMKFMLEDKRKTREIIEAHNRAYEEMYGKKVKVV